MENQASKRKPANIWEARILHIKIHSFKQLQMYAIGIHNVVLPSDAQNRRKKGK